LKNDGKERPCEGIALLHPPSATYTMEDVERLAGEHVRREVCWRQFRDHGGRAGRQLSVG
jgi:hypothetical protein